jgi:hypothetical protein
MEIKATSIVMVPINKIIPNEKNNNIHTEEQKRYARKIFDYQGFRAPLLISNRTGKLVAGHLRLEIAKEKGVTELPCMFQDFDSEEQEYAHLTADNALAAQSSLDFEQINLDIQELGPFDIELLGIQDFVVDLNEKEQEDDKYTRKVESPVYQPTGEKPTLPMLYDTEKTDFLLNEIENSALPVDIKLFLKLAAHRHTKFNYKNIAEYYAHANAEEQNLMEKSALVVIDFDKAIELGFVKLTKEIKEAFSNDYE